ncbi:hypothetical protein SCOR_34095 [Sulfidibacter corallicola]
MQTRPGWIPTFPCAQVGNQRREVLGRIAVEARSAIRPGRNCSPGTEVRPRSRTMDREPRHAQAVDPGRLVSGKIPSPTKVSEAIKGSWGWRHPFGEDREPKDGFPVSTRTEGFAFPGFDRTERQFLPCRIASREEPFRWAHGAQTNTEGATNRSIACESPPKESIRSRDRLPPKGSDPPMRAVNKTPERILCEYLGCHRPPAQTRPTGAPCSRAPESEKVPAGTHEERTQPQPPPDDRAAILVPHLLRSKSPVIAEIDASQSREPFVPLGETGCNMSRSEVGHGTDFRPLFPNARDTVRFVWHETNST